jgi:hypothetical protein
MEKACNKLQANSTNLQRHIKRDHLNVPGDSLTIKELVASKFDALSLCLMSERRIGWKIYPDFKIERHDRKLRVSPWDNLAQPFPPSPPRQAREQMATPIDTPTSPASMSPECERRVVTKTKELKTASREGKGSGKRTGRA